MRDFFKTASGKFVISLVFAIGALIVAEVGKFVTDNQVLFSGTALLVINAVLFALKNLFDPKIKNI